MKPVAVGFFSCILTLVIIYALVNSMEPANGEAFGIYLLVFSLPTIVLAATNGLFIFFVSKIRRQSVINFVWILPSVVLFLVSRSGPLVSNFLDADMHVPVLASAISFFVINLLWLIPFARARKVQTSS